MLIFEPLGCWLSSAYGDSVDGDDGARSGRLRFVRGVRVAPAAVRDVVGDALAVRRVVHVVGHVVIDVPAVGVVQRRVAHHSGVLVLLPFGTFDVFGVFNWRGFAAERKIVWLEINLKFL